MITVLETRYLILSSKHMMQVTKEIDKKSTLQRKTYIKIEPLNEVLYYVRFGMISSDYTYTENLLIRPFKKHIVLNYIYPKFVKLNKTPGTRLSSFTTSNPKSGFLGWIIIKKDSVTNIIYNQNIQNSCNSLKEICGI